MSEAAREILICLVAAHFLSDFILQTDADAARKRNPLILIKHAAIVAATSPRSARAGQTETVPPGAELAVPALAVQTYQVLATSDELMSK